MDVVKLDPVARPLDRGPEPLMATMEMLERVDRPLPAENMYGHTKKVRYIQEHVERRR